ncbi:MAG: hypothetical protein KAQ98_03535, partial [Bacteriovoracaceae bacterium]|nr:hypothetical protein [Bacteriovoracaceae bacterium]
MNSKLLDRFLRYVRVNTQSMHDAKCFPSTEGQFRLARILVRELKELGISDAKVDDHCYVIATLPSNIPTDHPAHGKVPAIGFVAHLDTSPDFSGENVSPNVIKYEGGDISIGVDPVTLEDIIIRELENPILSQSVGHTIVTTDGKT